MWVLKEFQYKTKHGSLSVIESWKLILDDKGFYETVLIDLSKAFDTLNHKLHIAKFIA